MSALPGVRSFARPWVGIYLTSFIVAAILLAALPVLAQYPGQITKTGKETPELRAIAVLEWTGEPGKPNRSRLVPIAVLDGGQLQDGAIYMARPEPLSLAGEVEYELEQNGKPIGLYDIRNASQEQGSWVGYGAWRPIPVARPKPAQQLAHTRIDDDVQSDEPVLHRKHHADDRPAGGTDKSGGAASSDGQTQPDDTAADPDRPTLHKKTSTAGTGETGSSQTPSSSSQTPDSSADPDKPTLHKRASADATTNSSETGDSQPSHDPDRPVLHKTRKQPDDLDHAQSVADATDPDRPMLKRGKSSGPVLDVVPTLIGLPPDVQQTVAVSDAKTHPVHPWTYSWSSPDDEGKMKSAMEDIARTALGLHPPPPPPAPKKATTPRTGTGTPAARKAKPAPPPPAPVPLAGEQFQVFELAYGSGATMVLSAHTDGPAAQQRFVTLVAQPDLYGNVLVLLKNVTDGAHLDETPRMRLVDAVDAMADNRGELLFEQRGATQRQFALYRVLRGQAEKLFVSGGEDFAIDSRN
jgi:hypothetical protein